MLTQVYNPTKSAGSPPEAREILSDLLKIADAARFSGNKARAVAAIAAVMAYVNDLEDRGE